MAENIDTLETKHQKLRQIIGAMQHVMVAFSGGVDSTLLLKVAKDVLGDHVLAVTALSETTARQERQDAQRLAEMLSVKHLLVESHELDLPEFVQNPPNKCYICKKSRFGALLEMAKARSIPFVTDGSNIDDRNDYRPGSLATRELGIRSPLCEAGFSKADIRGLSKRLGLSTWNKPSLACLASRIPYHSPITAEKLKQVDAGEDFLRSLGLSYQIRVRHDGDIARIELESQDIAKLTESALRSRVVQYFKALGFKYVTLDLEGYRMGSLNQVLP